MFSPIYIYPSFRVPGSPPGSARSWGKGKSERWRGGAERGDVGQWRHRPGVSTKIIFSRSSRRERGNECHLLHRSRTLQRHSHGACRAGHRSCERGSRDGRASQIWRRLGSGCTCDKKKEPVTHRFWLGFTAHVEQRENWHALIHRGVEIADVETVLEKLTRRGRSREGGGCGWFGLRDGVREER